MLDPFNNWVPVHGQQDVPLRSLPNGVTWGGSINSQELRGGFKYVLRSSLLGKMIQFD